MQKMKNSITTTIGTIDLNNIEFCNDMISVIIGITDVSEKLKSEIKKAINIEKDANIAKQRDLIKEIYTNNPGHEKELFDKLSFYTKWSDEIIIDNIYLDVDFKVGEKAIYQINVVFHDKENKMRYSNVSIAVDLSEYQNELKKIIINAMIDKFF